MADCRKCKHNYKMPGDEPRCNLMCDGESDFEPITNATRIRAMSDEELADWLLGIDHYWNDGECIVSFGDAHIHDSSNSILEWLQSEAK
ncbi:MAG: hypothetical protein J6Q61_00150 [Bacteroidales bacterium]|nr:hypothetical protein [Bacteroidales bacterium]